MLKSESRPILGIINNTTLRQPEIELSETYRNMKEYFGPLTCPAKVRRMQGHDMTLI
jgi:hypothetical protein